MFIPAKIGKIFLVNRFSLFYFPKTFQKSIAVFCSCSPSRSPSSVRHIIQATDFYIGRAFRSLKG